MQAQLVDWLADWHVIRRLTMRTRRTTARLHLLTVREVQTASAGDHSDGGGLQLRVTETAASWVFRFTAPSGKRREMGLGAVERNNAAAGRSLSAPRQLRQPPVEKGESALSDLPDRSIARRETSDIDAGPHGRNGEVGRHPNAPMSHACVRFRTILSADDSAAAGSATRSSA